MNPQRTTRVLIIEDSQIVQAVLARNLSAIPSVEVAGVACTGRSGINAIRELRPDVVLLDLTMPDGTGLDVLTAIREDEHRPLLIVLTFHCGEAIRARCFELGAHVFIDKAGNTQIFFDLLARLGAGELTIEEAKVSAFPTPTPDHE